MRVGRLPAATCTRATASASPCSGRIRPPSTHHVKRVFAALLSGVHVTFPNTGPPQRPIPEVRESRPCPKHSSRTSDRGSRPSPRAGSSSTCATPSGGSRRGGARGAPSRTSTATRRSSSPSSGSTSPSWSRADRPLPRRGEPGGVPRPFRGVRAARRGRGATPAALGLLPLSSVDRARLRGRGRGAVCDPDGRFALGPGSALPGVRARGALRRERGGGDLRLEAGVRDGRAVPARAAAELGSSALGVDSFRGRSGALAQATPPSRRVGGG